MTFAITPQELPRWVPGRTLCSSEGLGWRGVTQRTYGYQGLDVEVPPLSEFAIVSYVRGATPMERRFEGRWTRTRCGRDDISLMTRAQAAHWHWTDDIEVTHIYLTERLMSGVAEEMYERPVAEVRLHDLLRTQDTVVTSICQAITREAQRREAGSALIVDALGTQLAVHLLRHYAALEWRGHEPKGRLSPAQVRLVTDHIDAHLQDPLALEDLAALVGLGVWTFSRHFRESFGRAPHAFVIERRIERARRLLAQGRVAIKEVALNCGFADQAHLTRVMRRQLGTTPARLREGEP